MFTGIIEEIGSIRHLQRGERSFRIRVDASAVLDGMKRGDSICTDGICLTVVSFDESGFTVDAMPETVSRTTLRDARPGTRVNLERALRLSDRLGGHLVSGHIDGTALLADRREDDNAIRLRFAADAALLRYIVEKGSVAVDGVSLTVAGVDPSSFTVSVIPLTQEETTLTGKRAGERVNIECDIIGKYTEKLLRSSGSEGRIDRNFLAEHGFMD
jgi:riboflavin synthase